MTTEQREKIIDKILDENDDETLFNLLKLDLQDILVKSLESKTDDELLDIIL
jgi:hypothetical protein